MDISFYFSLLLNLIVVYQYPSNQPPSYDNAQLSAIRKFDEIYQQQHRYQSEQHFVHLKQQNLSFRVANTYVRQNFIRNHETNSFRIPQGDWLIVEKIARIWELITVSFFWFKFHHVYLFILIFYFIFCCSTPFFYCCSSFLYVKKYSRKFLFVFYCKFMLRKFLPHKYNTIHNLNEWMMNEENL